MKTNIISGVREELWLRGLALEFLLDDGQAEWVDSVSKSTPGSAHVWMISRQRGKSWAALAYAVNLCATQPGTIVRYLAQTGKSAAAIVGPTFSQILEDCPAALRPVEHAQEGRYEWPNGSTLVWAGTDNDQWHRARGPRSYLILLDESAFYGDLEGVEASLLPQLITTGGKVIYLSTPPENPAHPFVARYRAAQAVGKSRHATIEDNPRLGAEGVRRVLSAEAERLGMSLETFLKSTYCRREFFAEIVTEESRAVIPVWNEAMQLRAVVDFPRPQFFTAYTSLDWGYSPDPSAALLGEHLFETNTLYIRAEIEEHRGNMSTLAALVKQAEKEAWGVELYDGTLSALVDWAKVPPWLEQRVHSKAAAQPYLRVGDDDALLLAELSQQHGVGIIPTRKDEKHIAIDFVCQLLLAGRLKIHPSCKRLITQLYTTLWNRTRTQFERTAVDHGDLVDALVYLCRNVNWHRDPRPPPVLDSPGLPPETQLNNLAKAFGVGRRF